MVVHRGGGGIWFARKSEQPYLTHPLIWPIQIVCPPQLPFGFIIATLIRTSYYNIFNCF